MVHQVIKENSVIVWIRFEWVNRKSETVSTNILAKFQTQREIFLLIFKTNLNLKAEGWINLLSRSSEFLVDIVMKHISTLDYCIGQLK